MIIPLRAVLAFLLSVIVLILFILAYLREEP